MSGERPPRTKGPACRRVPEGQVPGRGPDPSTRVIDGPRSGGAEVLFPADPLATGSWVMGAEEAEAGFQLLIHPVRLAVGLGEIA